MYNTKTSIQKTNEILSFIAEINDAASLLRIGEAVIMRLGQITLADWPCRSRPSDYLYVRKDGEDCEMTDIPRGDGGN